MANSVQNMLTAGAPTMQVSAPGSVGGNSLMPTGAPPSAPGGGNMLTAGLTDQGSAAALAPQGPTPDDLAESARKISFLGHGLRELLAKPGGASRSDVIDTTGEMIAEQILSPQQAAQELASLPDDPGQIRMWLRQHVANTDAMRQAILGRLAPQAQQRQSTPPPLAPHAPQNMLTGVPYGQ